jgi:hypothetical protein
MFFSFFCWLVRLLETLLEWPQIQFVRPGGPVLPVKMPIGLGDRIDVQQSIGATFDPELGCSRVELFAIDAAVDDDMRDMNSERSEFARHRLRRERRPALADANAVNGGLPRRLAVAPVKMIVP